MAAERLNPGDAVWNPVHGWGRFNHYVGVTMARVDFAADGSQRVEAVTLMAGDDPAIPAEARETKP